MEEYMEIIRGNTLEDLLVFMGKSLVGVREKYGDMAGLQFISQVSSYDDSLMKLLIVYIIYVDARDNMGIDVGIIDEWSKVVPDEVIADVYNMVVFIVSGITQGQQFKYCNN
jgi:hypothetical protein